MNLISRSLRAPIIGSIFFCISISAALAERADRDKPTNVEANQMIYDDAKQLNTFLGNVVLTRGTLVMRAERLIIKKDASGHQHATLYAGVGGIVSFRQKRDGGKDLWIEGQAADRIEYDTKTEIAKLFKQSRIKMLDGSKITDEVEGELISYDSRAEFYSVSNTTTGESKPGAGRVRATIQPREKENKGDDK